MGNAEREKKIRIICEIFVIKVRETIIEKIATFWNGIQYVVSFFPTLIFPIVHDLHFLQLATSFITKSFSILENYNFYNKNV
jgi:hypothetical protein